MSIGKEAGPRPGASVRQLGALLARQQAADPGAPAFVQDGRAMSRAAFAAACARAGDWLDEQGIGPGDRVAVWLVNRPAWPALLFALAQRGAALVAVNTRYRASELEHLLALSRARLLITQRAFHGIDFPAVLAGVDGSRLGALERIALLEDTDESGEAHRSDGTQSAAGTPRPAADRVPGAPARLLDRPVVRLAGLDAGEAGTAGPANAGETASDRADSDRGDPRAPCVFFSTSGTTKGPKLVVHTQYTLTRHVEACARRLGFDRPGARLAAMMPLCGTYGLMAVLAAFAGGAPVHLFDRFDAQADARALREQALTHAFVTDDMLRRLAAEVVEDPPFPAARVFGFAAFAPGAAETATTLLARGLPVHGLYGSSEVNALFSIQDAALPPAARIAGGGQPMSADAQIRIRDLESGALLPIGETGEIEIRASTNFTGYFDNPQATRDAVDAEGFFRTGDVGHLREDGSFVYENRRDDSIRLSGFLVRPEEIEDPIKTLPGVADVQVVALPVDGRLRALAFVIPLPGTPPDPLTLIGAAGALMAPYRRPARVWLVDAFPSTEGPNGTKIQRGRLREWAQSRLAAEAPGADGS